MTTTLRSEIAPILSLEDWLNHPPENSEWVDGKLVNKHPQIWVDGEPFATDGMTLKHSRIQAKLGYAWASYAESTGQGGVVYTEAPCRTHKQGRSPDVAYLTPELVAQFGNEKVLPQSFPFSAEIASPTDFAEDLITKAQEYLQSKGLEVWLVFPEAGWVIVLTATTRQIFIGAEVISTQVILPGFKIRVDQLLA
ncbi:MAG: Uma2 family endonuclease [Aphanocapsa sp. GSE-SYN-MK-11-07L]|jgi:Uma2 family endonuclease|nr:Uma2 family endonuclease [Aphanocapsa sp. GSE-SYN-MK-11-07L]